MRQPDRTVVVAPAETFSPPQTGQTDVGSGTASDIDGVVSRTSTSANSLPQATLGLSVAPTSSPPLPILPQSSSTVLPLSVDAATTHNDAQHSDVEGPALSGREDPLAVIPKPPHSICAAEHDRLLSEQDAAHIITESEAGMTDLPL